MQYAENLSDLQAADAVRARIDWKYALSLELTDSGFDYSVLSEFRARLLDGSIEQKLLDTILPLQSTSLGSMTGLQELPLPRLAYRAFRLCNLKPPEFANSIACLEKPSGVVYQILVDPL